MLYDPDPEFVDIITKGDVPAFKRPEVIRETSKGL
jgi:hypothetical protein